MLQPSLELESFPLESQDSFKAGEDGDMTILAGLFLDISYNSATLLYT